jgi:hypothetical protein
MNKDEKSICSEFIQKVKAFYNVDNLDDFLAWQEKDRTQSFTLVIQDKVSKIQLAKAYGIFHLEKKSIDLITLDRYKTGDSRETYYKGLGKVLLYILVCKALDLNYMIRFKADDFDGSLIQYYKDRGFTQAKANNKRLFDTIPTISEFESRIAKTIVEMKDPSAIEYFQPSWISPTKKGEGWMIQCPICHKQANPLYQHITHEAICENKGKIANLSQKPKSGGRHLRRMNKKRTITHKIKRKKVKVSNLGTLN